MTSSDSLLASKRGDDEATLSSDKTSGAQLEKALIDLTRRVTELERSNKEQEPSFLRAVRTLVRDMTAFYRGEDPFPRAAILGVIFSYLRPRLVIVIGGILAAIFAGIQAYLLWSQNRLINNQTRYLQIQTEANQLEAISVLLSSLDPKDEAKTELAIAQLSEYGEYGFEALIRISRSGGDVSSLGLRALLGQAHIQTPTQVIRTLDTWSQVIAPYRYENIIEFTTDAYSLDSAQRLVPQVSISSEYFHELTARILGDKRVRTEVQAQLSQDDTFEYGLAYMHFLFLAHHDELTGGDPHDTYFLDWHVAVSDLADAIVVGQLREYSSYPKGRWHQVREWFSAQEGPGGDIQDSLTVESLTDEIEGWFGTVHGERRDTNR